MKDMELLAPVGSMEGLKAAVYNGANAVYLGIKEFNARNNIEGFNLDNLGVAVDFAHLYNVKVYLALNILFKDDELQSALDVVFEANNYGVDAFIVQDLGLAYLIHTFYPSIELHASTQMAVHNLEGVRVLEKLGFKRVVLARETSPDEIKRIHDNSDIEIEFFIQGALCVSFSGNCYMCSHLVGKSGNRGVCQQFCRLPYTFESGNTKKQGFLLSAKDINMLDQLEYLKQLGVVSLKIEGRARRPFYVAQACKVYRNMLDKGSCDISEIEKLHIAFNRKYTPSYFNGNNNIISQIQGNNGLYIGEVKKVNKGSKFNEVFITSNYELKGKCGLKFVYKGEEIASIGAYDIKPIGNLYRLTTTATINVGSKVNIIQDDNLEQEVLNKVVKLPIDIHFIATPNQPIKVIASYQNIQVEELGEVCQSAKTISVSSEQILKQLSRSDIFEISKFDCEINNCYILNSSINKLRNNIYNKLQQLIIKKYCKNKLNKININKTLFNSGLNSICINNLTDNKLNTTNNLQFNFKIINNINELNNNLKYHNLIFDYNIFDERDVKRFDSYCKVNNIQGYIDLPNFATQQDLIKIHNALTDTSLGVVANNIYALGFDCKMIGGQFLNIYNSFTIQVLNMLHPLDAMFVEELTDVELQQLTTSVPLLRRERVYMTLLHCPFKQNVGCNCGDCKYNEASYTINSGKKFKVKRKKTTSCVFLLKD